MESPRQDSAANPHASAAAGTGSVPEPPVKVSRRTVLVVGQTGCGKSAFCNALLSGGDKVVFKESEFAESMTLDSELREVQTKHGFWLRVVDTVGTEDNRMSTADVLFKLNEAVALAGTINRIYVVFRGRLVPSVAYALKTLLRLVAERQDSNASTLARHFVTLVRTGFPRWTDEKMCVEERQRIQGIIANASGEKQDFKIFEGLPVSFANCPGEESQVPNYRQLRDEVRNVFIAELGGAIHEFKAPSADQLLQNYEKIVKETNEENNLSERLKAEEDKVKELIAQVEKQKSEDKEIVLAKLANATELEKARINADALRLTRQHELKLAALNHRQEWLRDLTAVGKEAIPHAALAIQGVSTAWAANPNSLQDARTDNAGKAPSKKNPQKPSDLCGGSRSDPRNT